ncbi:GDP-mannose 4,6-dehydratase [Stratiformator vulcanicus]|uniref:GDP-mannose 4,6-dehydratase n=1 Tax=Stratiformator vulcanicus TaxID=2527980 RepID=A0A517QYQ4_9PLAN|nr:GDP-mannose 4,6-dehydratase [Stratiformator vulcanicus]QDT36734.1 GDP-mannose 4,6-dehydratase [Stratiformator vulcanicus]
MKKALITGITGQDGSYLAESLLRDGYEVHGLVRRVALEDGGTRVSRLSGFLDQLHLHDGSLESFPSIYQIVTKVRPDEVYHLGAQSFVAKSFDDAFSTLKTNIEGTHFVLEAVRQIVPECRFYFAGSSEMFGKVSESPQNESTPFHPRSPYGISKVTGFDLTRNYREAYGMFACSGILFNHESPRRGFEFVTRKISSHVAEIKAGRKTQLQLGNLEARRDWGYAEDYVEAMRLMLKHSDPVDFVIATGATHSVRDYCEAAFAEAGLDYRDHVVHNEQFERPAEVELLLGDASKAKAELGWEPNVDFEGLVRLMVRHDLERLGHSAASSEDRAATTV